jgi:integral membrane protein
MRATFLFISRLEAISFLLLLGIAMPLKYAANMPEALFCGRLAHGVLFTAYIIMLLIIWQAENWPFKEAFFGGVAAVLPLGPIWFEKRLKKRWKP